MTFINTVIAEPFQLAPQNPFIQILGLPQAGEARLTQPGKAQWSHRLSLTNTLNIESNPQESLYADYESYTYTIGLNYGLSEKLALKLSIPFKHYGRGNLDNAIDNWHQIFGLPRAKRPTVSDNQFKISYSNNAINLINLTTPTEGVTDIQLGLGHQLWRDQKTAISTWLIADLPTGNPEQLRGNNELDISVQLSASLKFSDNWAGYSNLGIVFPGSHQTAGTEINNQVLLGMINLEWSLNPRIKLNTQLNGHTAFYRNSQLRFLGDAYSIIIGGSIRFRQCSKLELAFSEDLKVGATPDVSFLINWQQPTSDCSK